MENITNPSWVQAGELGLAFIVIILCSSLVVYVMKTSASREKMFMDIIQTQTTALQRMADGLEDVVKRLETIETKVNIKPQVRKKTAKA